MLGMISTQSREARTLIGAWGLEFGSLAQRTSKALRFSHHQPLNRVALHDCFQLVHEPAIKMRE
jgi:hypothetical protein